MTPARPERAWFADTAPHHAALPARAALDTDAVRMTLDGAWSFRRLSHVPAGAGTGFEARDYDDSRWERIRVPHSWETGGTATAPADPAAGGYPFPVDPPEVPDENRTGEYRVWFDLPDAPGRGRWLLRFEGVDSGFEVFINATRVGDAMGSCLTHEFDVTAHLSEGRNLLAVRVHEWSAGSYLEGRASGRRPGITRTVSLLNRPDGGLDDLFVHAAFDVATRTGRLSVEGPPGAVVRLAELGIEVLANEEVAVPGVEPWSAEVPRLYRGTVSVGDPTPLETVQIAVGFRSVAIRDATLLVNGVPVRLRGVNRALGGATREDVELMKRHNINAVRTGHCPPDERFLALCDEYGLWVVDECGLDTHAFERVEWRRNPGAEPAWRDALLDRAQRMVELGKNHPCVIGWSLGGDSGRGANLDAMAEWVRARDPERFVLYVGDLDGESADVYARADIGPAETELVGRGEEAPAADLRADRRRRALPFVLCEEARVGGIGAAGLGEYVELFDEYPRLAGGFVGEWTGLLAPDHTPLPGLLEMARAYAPVTIRPSRDGVAVTSRYGHRSTGHLRFRFRIEDDGEPVASGGLEVPELGPGEHVLVPLPEPAPPTPARPAGAQRWLTVSAELPAGTPWAPAGHEVAWGQTRIVEGGEERRRPAHRPARPPGDAPAVARPDGGWDLGAGRFEPSGRLVGLSGIPVLGPRLDLWRAPTDRDERGLDESRARAWRELGLDRLCHRTVSMAPEENALSVVAHVMPAGTDVGYEVEYRWRGHDGGLGLDVVGSPLGPWTLPVPRLGVQMAVPRALNMVRWVGLGPSEAYPGASLAVRQGRFSSGVAGLQTPFPRPQENGARRGVRWAELSGAGSRFTVRGEGFILAVRPWTSESLAATAHAADLVDDPEWLWVTMDEEHDVDARRFRLSLELRADAGAVG